MDSKESFPSIHDRLRLYEKGRIGHSTTPKIEAIKRLEKRDTVVGNSVKQRLRMYQSGGGADSKGGPSQTELITLAEIEGDHFRINDIALQNFLGRRELRGRPIVIVSIAGAFRSGKSFIMNFFIRYLQENGWKNPNWFGAPEDKVADGFEWRRGTIACTKGIHVWSNVFHVPLCDGREAAVLLVDTQGLFDDDTSPDTNAKIMSISTLFSSHQILNLMRHIEERDLEHLQLCVAFATAAMSDGKSDQSKPFQTLTFLIRDWEFDFDCGDSTNGYLKKYFLKRSMSDDVQRVKESIPAAFKDVKCFLLPRPGKNVTRSDGMNLLNKDMDDDFQEFTKILVESLFHPRNIVIKRRRNGEEATADDLLHMIRLVGKSFASGEIPKAKTLLQYMAGTNNTRALNEAFSAYKERLRELCSSNLFYTNPREKAAKEYHERALKLAVIQFRYMANMGDEESKVEYLARLKKKCEEEFHSFWDVNKNYEPEDDCSGATELSDFGKTYRKIDSTLKLYSPTERNPNSIFSSSREYRLSSSEDVDGDADLLLDNLSIDFSYRDWSRTSSPSFFD